MTTQTKNPLNPKNLPLCSHGFPFGRCRYAVRHNAAKKASLKKTQEMSALDIVILCAESTSC